MAMKKISVGSRPFLTQSFGFSSAFPQRLLPPSLSLALSLSHSLSLSLSHFLRWSVEKSRKIFSLFVYLLYTLLRFTLVCSCLFIQPSTWTTSFVSSHHYPSPNLLTLSSHYFSSQCQMMILLLATIIAYSLRIYNNICRQRSVIMCPSFYLFTVFTQCLLF